LKLLRGPVTPVAMLAGEQVWKVVLGVRVM